MRWSDAPPVRHTGIPRNGRHDTAPFPVLLEPDAYNRPVPWWVTALVIGVGLVPWLAVLAWLGWHFFGR